MRWVRQRIRKVDNIVVNIILDGDGGVRYINDYNSVFPSWSETYYDSALEVYAAMEYYHEDPEFEEV